MKMAKSISNTKKDKLGHRVGRAIMLCGKINFKIAEDMWLQVKAGLVDAVKDSGKLQQSRIEFIIKTYEKEYGGNGN